MKSARAEAGKPNTGWSCSVWETEKLLEREQTIRSMWPSAAVRGADQPKRLVKRLFTVADLSCVGSVPEKDVQFIQMVDDRCRVSPSIFPGKITYLAAS